VLAGMRGIDELFALTMTEGFFVSAGYVITERARYPEKIRRDCSSCARRFGCAEVCVAHVLRGDTMDCAA
jgi:amino-acid N-acetyltransferase